QATVTITVLGSSPTASNLSYTVNEDQTLSVPAPGLIFGAGANDTNTPFIASTITAPANGTLTLDANNDGGFTYTPNPGFAGADSFSYKITDSDGDKSSQATVSITVFGSSPVANSVSYTDAENTVLHVS